MSTGHKGYGHHIKRRSIRALILAAICIVAIILAILITNLVIIPSASYNSALRAMESYNYLKAVREFVQLDDYKDSLENTVFCLEKIYRLELGTATTTALSPWWNITADGQLSFNPDEYNGDGNISIPHVIDGIVVSAIAEQGFANCYDIISIEIPDSVTAIHDGAFYYCTALQTITIPSSVKKIGDNAFFSNMSLKTVELPAYLNSLGDSAFENCANLVSVNIPRRITVIADLCFKSCTALQTITFDGIPEKIESSAFSGCDAISTIYYSDTLNTWQAINISPGNDPILNAEVILKQ